MEECVHSGIIARICRTGDTTAAPSYSAIDTTIININAE